MRRREGKMYKKLRCLARRLCRSIFKRKKQQDDAPMDLKKQEDDAPPKSGVAPPPPTPAPASPPSPRFPRLMSANRSAHEVKQTHHQQHQPAPSRLSTLPLPVPTYTHISCVSDAPSDLPGPRCGHTLSAVPSTDSLSPRLILFGGATSIEDPAHAGGSLSDGSGGRLRLKGVTNDVHCYHISANKWMRLHPYGEPVSPRAGHASVAVGSMLVTQGGVRPGRLATKDILALDLADSTPIWHRIVVEGPGPGPRYGHVMALVQQQFLVVVGGTDGKQCFSDAWSLDTQTKPYEWRKLEPEGDTLPSCMYATASVRKDGLLLIYGGRDGSQKSLDSAYALIKHGDWCWKCIRVRSDGAHALIEHPNGYLEMGHVLQVAPTTRYQHAAVFVDSRLHVTGGTSGGGKMIEGPASAAAAALHRVDCNGLTTCAQTISPNQGTGNFELTRRCRHAAATVGKKIYIYGGLREGLVLDDLVVAEDTSEVVVDTLCC